MFRALVMDKGPDGVAVAQVRERRGPRRDLREGPHVLVHVVQIGGWEIGQRRSDRLELRQGGLPDMLGDVGGADGAAPGARLGQCGGPPSGRA